MGSSQKKAVGRLVRALGRCGHEVTLSGGGHWKVKAPQGMVFGSQTPSDYRAFRNFKAQLRRAGVHFEGGMPVAYCEPEVNTDENGISDTSEAAQVAATNPAPFVVEMSDEHNSRKLGGHEVKQENQLDTFRDTINKLPENGELNFSVEPPRIALYFKGLPHIEAKMQFTFDGEHLLGHLLPVWSPEFGRKVGFSHKTSSGVKSGFTVYYQLSKLHEEAAARFINERKTFRTTFRRTDEYFEIAVPEGALEAPKEHQVEAPAAGTMVTPDTGGQLVVNDEPDYLPDHSRGQTPGGYLAQIQQLAAERSQDPSDIDAFVAELRKHVDALNNMKAASPHKIDFVVEGGEVRAKVSFEVTI